MEPVLTPALLFEDPADAEFLIVCNEKAEKEKLATNWAKILNLNGIPKVFGT